jgi:hypothetical protein
MIGDAAQYQELVTLYAGYGDAELLGLAREMSDLTDMAQQALRGEMSRRALKASPAPKATESRVLSGDDLADLRAFAALAAAASLALREAGIESVVLQGDGSRMDVQGPRVVVAPEDAKDARTLLSQPLAERFKTEVDEAVSGEFATPACPMCGSHETLLEAVEPANRWLCDNCGNDWLENNVSPEIE